MTALHLSKQEVRRIGSQARNEKVNECPFRFGRRGHIPLPDQRHTVTHTVRLEDWQLDAQDPLGLAELSHF
jgi:hypothetical protein